ncbi:response regulator [Balneolaceae bacterium ANBcel3]|nr:response regulator [Balneolaceae bacterium ANBcel3]
MSDTSKKIKLKIFLVDDDPFFLNVMSETLNKIGLRDITMFESGKDCLKSLDEKPDIIFLDFYMENHTAEDVIKDIKKQSPNSYVVMVTGQENVKKSIDMLMKGAFDYVQKGPKQNENIVKVLKKIIRQMLLKGEK